MLQAPSPTDLPLRPNRAAKWPWYLAWIVYGSLLAVTLGGWLIYAQSQSSVLHYAYRYDFLNMYIGIQAILSGQGSHLYNLDLQRQLTALALAPYARPIILPYAYPGYVALVLAPLGLLNYGSAFAAWGGVNLLLTGRILWRLRLLAPPVLFERGAVLLAASAFMPLFLVLLQGQFALLPLLGLIEAYLALRAGQRWRAGGWLLLGLIKPQLIVLPLLVLLLRRQWRGLLLFGVGAGLLLALSLIVLGNWIPSYFTLLAQLQDQALNQNVAIDAPIAMQNWRALVYTLLTTETTPLALVLLSSLTLLSLVITVVIAWPGRGHGPGELPFVMAIVLGLLFTPHLYLHDMVIALLPGVVLWQTVSQARQANPLASTARRLQLLQGLLAVGSLIFFIAQFWEPPRIALVPWYLVILLLVIFSVWPVFIRGSASGLATPAGQHANVGG